MNDCRCVQEKVQELEGALAHAKVGQYGSET